MIDIKKLASNKEFFLKKFTEKGYSLEVETTEVLNLFEKYNSSLKEEQEVRSELNTISKEIKANPSEEIKAKAKDISTKAKEITSIVSSLKEELEDKLLYFPNIARDDVKVGKDENDNVVLSTHNDDHKKEGKKPHWEWLEDNKHILTEESGFISGSRHIIYRGKLAQLVAAVEKFMLDNHDKAGIEIIEPPVIVNKEALVNTGQLPKFKEDLYELDNGQFLIPTAEVPLTNLVANKMLSEQELPIRYAAATNCFRQEAGAAGRDNRGLIRVHQFRKVELVTIGRPEDEEKDFNAMLSQATSLLDQLEIPYRVIQLCTGDASFTSAMTYDIEVWMPGVNEYREISSVSTVRDFQSRRMKARYKDDSNDKHFVYTYNGSALAIERTIAAIIENYVNKEGILEVPKVLQPYVDFKTI